VSCNAENSCWPDGEDGTQTFAVRQEVVEGWRASHLEYKLHCYPFLWHGGFSLVMSHKAVVEVWGRESEIELEPCTFCISNQPFGVRMTTLIAYYWQAPWEIWLGNALLLMWLHEDSFL